MYRRGEERKENGGHVLEDLTWQEEGKCGEKCESCGEKWRCSTLRDYTAVAAISAALERVHRVSESTARAEDLSFNEGDPVGQMSRSGVLTDFRDNDVCRLSRPRRPWARFNEWRRRACWGASRR